MAAGLPAGLEPEGGAAIFRCCENVSGMRATDHPTEAVAPGAATPRPGIVTDGCGLRAQTAREQICNERAQRRNVVGSRVRIRPGFGGWREQRVHAVAQPAHEGVPLHPHVLCRGARGDLGSLPSRGEEVESVQKSTPAREPSTICR